MRDPSVHPKSKPGSYQISPIRASKSRGRVVLRIRLRFAGQVRYLLQSSITLSNRALHIVESLSAPSSNDASAPTSFDFAVDVSEEERRLAALYRYDVLDTPPEHAFDHIAELAADLLEAPIALVSLIDRDRQWFKACVGLNDRQTGLDASFCVYAIQSEGATIVPDARADARFADSPLVAGEPGIRFYAGVPLEISSGHRIGTLCVIDTEPRADLAPAKRKHLKHLAQLVVDELELRREVKVRARREDELDRAREAAEAARQEAEEAHAAMSRFLAGIAHDLRTPLTRMLLFLDLLERSMDEPPTDHLETIRTSGQQLESMIGSLLELSHLRSGRVSLDRSPVDVGELVRTVWAKVEDAEATAQRTVELDLPDEPLQVLADPDALSRVIENLVRNAIKYTTVGDQISIAAHPTQVVFDAEHAADGGTPAVCIEICDTGPGIESDLLDTLFTPFVRGSDDEEGMGLGLAIAKDLMEAMDGAIRVESEVGTGTCFQLLAQRT